MFEAFVQQHTRWLLRFATALSGDAASGEDLVQDVLIKVHRHWTRIETLDAPAAYVRRMLVNEHVSWRRKWARIIPTATVHLTSQFRDVADSYAERDALLAELRRLPARQRAVLALRYFEGLSDSQIAEVLGCQVSTVRGYASRGLTALRRRTSTLTPHAEGTPTS